MLHSIKDMTGLRIAATDAVLGSIDEVYFDDLHWGIRYFVVKTGGWMAARKVLISPMAVTSIDWEDESVHVALSAEQVRSSPHIDMDKPVSRQHEAEFAQYYGYNPYWTGPYLWEANTFPGVMDVPIDIDAKPEVWKKVEEGQGRNDPHLRSSREVGTYHIRTTDETQGHVEDFLFNDRNWVISHLVLESRDWWPGKHVVVHTRRVQQIDATARRLALAVTREELEHSPDYDLMSANPEGAVQDLYQRFWRAPYSP